jgi:probable LLM family oxidoreductase
MDAGLPAERIEFGLNSFGEVPTDDSGRSLTEAETVRLLVAEAKLAESVGIDSFSIGEHYRAGHVDTAGHMILAAIAASTERIGLGTSVTVLSTRDPVRVFADFSTLSALSHGRAKLVVGRASSVESFPLFGHDLANYDTLFEEKLELLDRLVHARPVTWSGTTRTALSDQVIAPALEGELPVWVGVGGSPDSVVRAARHRMPLMLAIIGGSPARFRALVGLYQHTLEQLGHPPLPVGQHSLGFIADTDDQARDILWPHWDEVISTVGRERGFPPPNRADFDQSTRHGALYVGSPETIARRIATTIGTLGLSRFDLKYDIGRLSAQARSASIRLYGEEVVPRVRKILSNQDMRAV